MFISDELSSDQEEADTKVVCHCHKHCKKILMAPLSLDHPLATPTS